jgi:hypothetical protein
MARTQWCGCGVKFHFGYAIAGILIGLSAAPIFGVQYHNISATTFAVISSLFAACMFCVCVYCDKHKYRFNDYSLAMDERAMDI